MRRRKKPNAVDKLLELKEMLILEPQKYQGQWSNISDNKRIHVELGTGRGQFINTLANKHKDIFFLGVEIKEEILLEAVKKTVNLELDNLKFLWFNINYIDSIFYESEIDRIYINFCDPWPKKRHSKRRLTHKNFLIKYKKILNSSGELHFKTDCEELFEFTLNEVSNVGFKIKEVSLNLYRNGNIDNVKTEYEEKFIEQGKKIYKLVAINNK